MIILYIIVNYQVLDLSHSEYIKLIIKSACKSSPDTYKSNFPCGKFLFNSKFKPM